jgi:Arc/MetJ-type ribon-helix-helix transcriptional regulator
MSKQLSIRIDDELEELIEKEQDSTPYDIPTSEIVRTALREHLSGNASARTAATVSD